jgi:GntR family transcriptional regulator / MocR family aminotransferase
VKAWAGSGRDLLLYWDDRTGVRRGIEHALRTAIQTGRLKPGTILPSSRLLAVDLGVARNTVADVYAQLIAEGYLDAVPGSRTWVRELPAHPEPLAAETRSPPVPAYDLTPGRPDVGLFPRAQWAKTAAAALAAAPASMLSYGDARGAPQLRSALAGYLGRARGVGADPGNIVVCTGFTQAIELLARIHHHGTVFAVEDPTLPATVKSLQRHGIRIHHLPVDDEGARTDQLFSIEGCAAVVLTPAHQFPIGVPLSTRRRIAAIRWAHQAGGIVIEDDYDGELRYDREPIGAIQGLAPDHVVYVGTTSKTLAPGLRLAWMVVPQRFRAPLMTEKEFADRHSAILDQLSLARFIETGAFDHHIRKARNHYRARRHQLMETLHGQHVSITGIDAGLHAVVGLDSIGREQRVLDNARDRNLTISPLRAFTNTAPTQPALVVGYGTPPQHAYRHALELLRSCLK